MRLFYRLLLLAYPRSLRQEHGDEMAIAVNERWRETRGATKRIRLLWDLVTDFFRSWLSVWRPAHTPRQEWSAYGGESPLARLAQDVRAAVRLLRHAPLFSASAILTLGLGIGATTAVVSLADATLLHPLPIPSPSRVIQEKSYWSYPDFRDAVEVQRGFSSIAAWATPPIAVESHGVTTQVYGAGVSGGYFTLAGQRPLAGRLIGDEDDRPGAPAAVVVSARLWRDAFGAEDIIGRRILINGTPVTVVGIAPAGFRGLSLQISPDLFVSLTSLPGLVGGFLARPGVLTNRGMAWLQLAARLADGATEHEADLELNQIHRRFHPPVAGKPPGFLESSPILAQAIGLSNANDLRRFIWVLTAATALTLLLTCATVANLLLLRAERRRRELAVHAALGAGRERIARLLLIESLVIGAGGGALAVGVALAALQLVGTLALPGHIVIADLHVTADVRLLVVAVSLGLVTSALFGIAPIWQLRRLNVMATLRAGSRTTARQTLRKMLVGVQVAACVLLLSGSLALGRALQFALSTDLGFDETHTTLASIAPGLVRYPQTRVAELHRQVLDSLRAQSSVRAAGWSALPPLSGGMRVDLGVEGYQTSPGESMTVDDDFVSDGYFQAMGIRVINGRAFSANDTFASPRVVVVSASLAAKYWPHGAVGRHVTLGAGPGGGALATIVGVVSDVHRAVGGPAVPMVYEEEAQNPQAFDSGQYWSLITMASRDPIEMARDVTATLRRIDPVVPIVKSDTMLEHVEATLAPNRLGLLLFIAFGALAVLLTGLGLHAVVSYAVAHRTREIGLHVALGAASGDVLRLVAKEGLVPVAWGLIAGMCGFLASSAVLRQFMFGVPANRPVALLAVAAGVAAIAALAMLVPARRALAVEPAVALRNE